MKYLFSILSFFLFSSVNAQIKNGIYKSSKASFRENYILIFEGEKATLIGWELVGQKDTIYYRSSAKLDENKHLHFDKFDFSKKGPLDFKPDKSLSMVAFVLHNNFMFSKANENSIFFLAVTDIYGNRADEFVFEKI
jgi:hypothetical protein